MAPDTHLTSLSFQDTGRTLGEAEDLAAPAVFLASDASDFINGHVLYVDGGILAYIASSRSK